MSNLDKKDVFAGYKYGFFLQAGDTSHDSTCSITSAFMLSTHSQIEVDRAFSETERIHNIGFLDEFYSGTSSKLDRYFSEKCYLTLVNLGLLPDCINVDGSIVSYADYKTDYDSEDAESYICTYVLLAKISLPSLNYKLLFPGNYQGTIDLKGDLLTNPSF